MFIEVTHQILSVQSFKLILSIFFKSDFDKRQKFIKYLEIYTIEMSGI